MSNLDNTGLFKKFMLPHWTPGDNRAAANEVAAMVNRGKMHEFKWEKVGDRYTHSIDEYSITLSKPKPHYFEVQVHSTTGNSIWTRSYEVELHRIKEISSKTERAIDPGALDKLQALWDSLTPATNFDPFDL